MHPSLSLVLAEWMMLPTQCVGNNLIGQRMLAFRFWTLAPGGSVECPLTSSSDQHINEQWD